MKYLISSSTTNYNYEFTKNLWFISDDARKTTTLDSSKRVVLINGSSLWESRPSESRPSVKHVGRDYWKSHPGQIMHIQCYIVLVWALHPCSGVEEIDVNCCQQRLDKPRPNNTMSKVVMVVISKLLDNRGSY